MPSNPSSPAILIAAHRGGSLEKPENTLEALNYAIALGAEQVEFDIHLSADDVPVVHHDSTLDRMTDDGGPIRSKSWEELQTIRIKGSATETVPGLEAFLQPFQQAATGVRLEIKPGRHGELYAGIERQVIEALDRHGLLDRTTITSFAVDYLRSDVLRSAPVPRILLVNPMVFFCIGRLDGIERVLALADLRHFALPADDIEPELVAAAESRGLVLSAFGGHTEPQIRKALSLGIPVFTSDRPALAMKLRAEMAAGRPA